MALGSWILKLILRCVSFFDVEGDVILFSCLAEYSLRLCRRRRNILHTMPLFIPRIDCRNIQVTPQKNEPIFNYMYFMRQ